MSPTIIADAPERDRDALLRVALDGALIGFYERDLRTGRGYWSTAKRALMGVGPEFVINSKADWLGIVHPQDRARLEAALSAAVSGHATYDAQYRIIRPDGAERWVHSRGEVERDASGVPVRLIGVCFDITPQKVSEATLADLEEQAQQALRESEERLALAYEAGRIGAWEYQPETGQVRWTEEFYAAYGFGRSSESTLAAFRDRVHPDDRELLDRTRAAEVQAENGASFAIELRILLPGGETRWLERRSRVRVTAGMCRVLGVNIDVTERKRSEQALRESDERFRTLATSIDDVFYVTDLERGSLEYLSPSYERVWGRPVAELMADLASFIQTIHPDDHALFDEGKAAQMRGEPVTAEYRIVRPNGEVRWIYDRSFPVPGALGRRSAGIASDVTERKRAEDALRESEERFRMMADDAPVLIWVNSVEGNVFVNRAYREFVGVLHDADLRGYDWTQYVHPDDRASYVGAYLKCLEGRERFEAQFRFRRADGQYRWMQSVGTPRISASGDFLGYLGSSADISDIKAHEAHIHLMLGELSHRSKNLLAVVQAMVRQTARHADSMEEFQEQLADRISALASAHDLLVAQNWEGAPVRELVEKQVHPFDDLHTGRISIEGPDTIVCAQAAQSLALAVHELATNASKYGALSVTDGHVDIGWAVEHAPDRTPRFWMRWSERGGPPVKTPRRQGFGSFVLERMAGAGLNGKSRLDYGPDGLVWTLTSEDTSFLRTRGGAIARDAQPGQIAQT